MALLLEKLARETPPRILISRLPDPADLSPSNGVSHRPRRQSLRCARDRAFGIVGLEQAFGHPNKAGNSCHPCDERMSGE